MRKRSVHRLNGVLSATCSSDWQAAEGSVHHISESPMAFVVNFGVRRKGKSATQRSDRRRGAVIVAQKNISRWERGNKQGEEREVQ